MARPDIQDAIDAFNDSGDAIVTPKNGDPFTTRGFFLPSKPDEVPFGEAIGKRNPLRVFVVARAGFPVAGFERGTVVVVAEFAGDAPTNWTVDGLASDAEPDAFRLLLRPKGA